MNGMCVCVLLLSVRVRESGFGRSSGRELVLLVIEIDVLNDECVSYGWAGFSRGVYWHGVLGMGVLTEEEKEVGAESKCLTKNEVRSWMHSSKVGNWFICVGLMCNGALLVQTEHGENYLNGITDRSHRSVGFSWMKTGISYWNEIHRFLSLLFNCQKSSVLTMTTTSASISVPQNTSPEISVNAKRSLLIKRTIPIDIDMHPAFMFLRC